MNHEPKGNIASDKNKVQIKELTEEAKEPYKPPVTLARIHKPHIQLERAWNAVFYKKDKQQEYCKERRTKRRKEKKIQILIRISSEPT